MKVSVTASDIELGIRSSEEYCPIACALKRLGYEHVSVIPNTCKFDGKRKILPTAARLFIEDFDRGRDVKPFEFVL